MKLPGLPESLKIPGSQLKLSSDPIGQGERKYTFCTCTLCMACTLSIFIVRNFSNIVSRGNWNGVQRFTDELEREAIASCGREDIER